MIIILNSNISQSCFQHSGWYSENYSQKTSEEFAQYCKKDTVLTISGWDLKLGEYTAMANATVYIPNRSLKLSKNYSHA